MVVAGGGSAGGETKQVSLGCWGLWGAEGIPGGLLRGADTATWEVRVPFVELGATKGSTEVAALLLGGWTVVR